MTRTFAKETPRKVIISVVMISLTPWLAFRKAGSSDQTAPTAAPMTRQSTSTSHTGSTVTASGAVAATITAPRRNWPSPPRFQMPARKATIRLAAIRSSGAMRVSEAWKPVGDRSPRWTTVA